MAEFTSLKVSKRLAAMGFDAPDRFDTVGYPFKWLEHAPDDADLVGGWHGKESGDGPTAYHSGTLLEWLVVRDWDISIGKPHDKVLVDAASMKAQLRLFAEADTIPDALADIVFAILAPKPKGVIEVRLVYKER